MASFARSVRGSRATGLAGPRAPGATSSRDQACLASVRLARRAPLTTTLTGPSHGAPRAPPACPGAAATAAAAIPGPGAAPHPERPPPNNLAPGDSVSASRPRRGEMASRLGAESDAQEYAGEEGAATRRSPQRPLWWENELLPLGLVHVNRAEPRHRTPTRQ